MLRPDISSEKAYELGIHRWRTKTCPYHRQARTKIKGQGHKVTGPSFRCWLISRERNRAYFKEFLELHTHPLFTFPSSLSLPHSFLPLEVGPVKSRYRYPFYWLLNLPFPFLPWSFFSVVFFTVAVFTFYHVVAFTRFAGGGIFSYAKRV